jgi:hypothetical protein
MKEVLRNIVVLVLSSVPSGFFVYYYLNAFLPTNNVWVALFHSLVAVGSIVASTIVSVKIVNKLFDK